jgi:hypothetical protein
MKIFEDDLWALVQYLIERRYRAASLEERRANQTLLDGASSQLAGMIAEACK